MTVADDRFWHFAADPECPLFRRSSGQSRHRPTITQRVAVVYAGPLGSRISDLQLPQEDS
jgi:hypothetical protein